MLIAQMISQIEFPLGPVRAVRAVEGDRVQRMFYVYVGSHVANIGRRVFAMETIEQSNPELSHHLPIVFGGDLFNGFWKRQTTIRLEEFGYNCREGKTELHRFFKTRIILLDSKIRQ